MAEIKTKLIKDLDAISDLDDSDLLVIEDLDKTSGSDTGTRKVTKGALLNGLAKQTDVDVALYVDEEGYICLKA